MICLQWEWIPFCCCVSFICQCDTPKVWMANNGCVVFPKSSGVPSSIISFLMTHVSPFVISFISMCMMSIGISLFLSSLSASDFSFHWKFSAMHPISNSESLSLMKYDLLSDQLASFFNFVWLTFSFLALGVFVDVGQFPVEWFEDPHFCICQFLF